MNNRRESSKDENKTKDNELKAKRSNTSVNGKKDHGETVPKVIRILKKSIKTTLIFLL